MVFKEEPESSDGIDDEDDYNPENGGDSDYEPERKPRKRSSAIVRKPKTEMQNDEGGGEGCDSNSGPKVRFMLSNTKQKIFAT